jgi:hypothetical protein
MKLWFNNRFSVKKTEEFREWRTESSILKFISSHLDSKGKLTAEAVDLPDKNEDNEQLKFAPGLMDAMSGTEDSTDSQKRAGKLANLLKKIADKGDKNSEQEFYRLITEDDNTIGIIDNFLQSIVRKSLSTQPYLFSFAKDLATKSDQRNAVKFGIAILGLCQNKSVLDDLKILGLHDEFTVYSTIAIAQLSDNPVLDLWHLAEKVDGWGKIQLVERLAVMDIDQPIKDWLIREGYKNSIMYEYLAYTCALHGELHEKLQQLQIDQQLFRSAADLLKALIAENNPAEDISTYSHAASVVENFIRHSRQHAGNIADLNTLYQLKDFLSELQNDPKPGSQNGWKKNLIAHCLAGIADILNSRDWKPLVYEDLKSPDNITYWNAKQAAKHLGIDLWATVWHRLQVNPADDSAWFDVTYYSKTEHAGQIIDFAIRNLPLDELATGPKDSLGLGAAYVGHHCLDTMISYLENYPRQGEKIILTGLKSPVTRNRNMTIRVLNKWKRANWSPQIEKELMHLKNIEPNKETRKDIEKLLNGQNI